jgi:hypothetical protein
VVNRKGMGMKIDPALTMAQQPHSVESGGGGYKQEPGGSGDHVSTLFCLH